MSDEKVCIFAYSRPCSRSKLLWQTLFSASVSWDHQPSWELEARIETLRTPQNCILAWRSSLGLVDHRPALALLALAYSTRQVWGGGGWLQDNFNTKLFRSWVVDQWFHRGSHLQPGKKECQGRAGHNIATRSENQFWVLISHCCLGHPPQSSAAYPRELGSTFYNLHHTKDESPSIVSCRFCAIYLHLRQSIKTLQRGKPSSSANLAL